MNLRKLVLYIGLWGLIIMGGCSNMENSNEKEVERDINAKVPVQEYIGQGKDFVDGEKSAETVKKNEKEIESLAIEFMKTNYKTDVKVNEVYPAKNAAVVFVESTQEPFFQTSVVVKVDIKGQTILGIEEVFSDEGDVENAIMSGLYYMAYEEEFKLLEAFIESELEKYPIVGLPEEALKHTNTGVMKPCYYISLSELGFPDVYQAYMNNQAISAEELRGMFEKTLSLEEKKESKVRITLNFYMEKEKSSPDPEVANQIIEDLKQLQGTPPGAYSVLLSPNSILLRSGQGVTEEGVTEKEGTGIGEYIYME